MRECLRVYEYVSSPIRTDCSVNPVIYDDVLAWMIINNTLSKRKYSVYPISIYISFSLTPLDMYLSMYIYIPIGNALRLYLETLIKTHLYCTLMRECGNG